MIKALYYYDTTKMLVHEKINFLYRSAKIVVPTIGKVFHLEIKNALRNGISRALDLSLEEDKM